eukprot:gb/GEZJ01002858.1/.p1 GENE.gb/GEZJ01002858.1/~~gb/GEZJ01002858.1/.p1  ORF type:complete len:443 (-),score=51.04 gb/GEZJ01002858.1/:4742-6070(-)
MCSTITPAFTASTPLSTRRPASTFHSPLTASRLPRKGPLPLRSRRVSVPCASLDYYQTLGISRSATEKEIKTAFRQKARKLHPDVNKAPDAKERFQEVSRAYEVLSDANLRQRYDQFGEAGVKGASQPGFGDFSSQDFGSFSDIFDTFFGGGQGSARARRRSGPQPGDDLRLDVDIPFETAVFGAEQKIRFSHLETCSTCSGSGVKPGKKPKSCSSCDGSGSVTQVVRTPLGMFQQTTTCTTCRGTGEVVEEYCGSCGGRGRNQVTKQLQITVPAGVDSGSRLRVRNEGDAGAKGGPPGDLYVVLRVKDSSDFSREGTNIYSKISISYLDAILGRSIPVKTVDGFVDLNISPGTQPGSVQRIDGKGVPKLGNSIVRGDQFVTVNVKIPTRLNGEERKLIQKLDDLTSGNAGKNGKATAGTVSEKSKKSSKKSEGFFNFGKKK